MFSRAAQTLFTGNFEPVTKAARRLPPERL